MGHVPIEISSLCYHFLNNNEQNTLTAIITGKRIRGLDLVVPAELFFQTEDRKSADTLQIVECKEEKPIPNCDSDVQ